jgi:membrane fusion protein, copper/silver efflux system
MNTLTKGMAIVAAVTAAALAGLWAGQTGVVVLPVSLTAGHQTEPKPQPTGPVVYYRDAGGKPIYSLTPRSDEGGRPFAPVHASEDVSFDPKALAKTEDGGPSGERKIKYYRNPMGLPDTSPVPKKDSMGMDYIPVYEGEESDDGTIKVSPGKIQRTGVETVEVTRRPITRTIKAPGVVQLDERRVAVVAPRFDGYVEKVGPVTTGTHVRNGDILAEVFGQDVLNQAARLLVERATAWTRGDDAFKPGTDTPGGLIGATRRLQNMGVPDEFIDKVKKDRRVPDTFAYRSPIDGFVLERNWSDGQGFKAGEVAFRIADHSMVWMMADVAESDAGAVKVGQQVEVTAKAHSGRTFHGKVAVVYPHLMKRTRTVQVRIELPNPDLALLPDMYGEVAISTGGETEALAVPVGALIDSGHRQVVLVNAPEGRFEPRDVKVGRRADGFVELLSGVSEGERVVADGNFLIDAESNLQSALKAFETSPAKEASK